MKTEFTDQFGTTISLTAIPQRIVSLVPSQTELLYDLGLDDRVVGITKFCVHPASWRHLKTIVGGTKVFHFDVIDALSPDLIIGNKEENYQEGIRNLKQHYPVWMSDISTMDDALAMITSIGDLTRSETQATQIISEIRTSFNQPFHLPNLRVLYLIWSNPWMGAGSSTFINEMLQRIGLMNVLADSPRYPELSEDVIRSLSPDVVLLSSEPFPFKEQHRQALAQLLPSSSFVFVDGEMFSWYGSRLIKAAQYFRHLFKR